MDFLHAFWNLSMHCYDTVLVMFLKSLGLQSKVARENREFRNVLGKTRFHAKIL